MTTANIKLELIAGWINLASMPKPDKPKKLTKDERLAQQLRANLRRRKAAVKRQKPAAELDETPPKYLDENLGEG